MDAIVTPINWRILAACRSLADFDSVFFGLDGERDDDRDTREAAAKRVCSGCPVRLQCLLDALDGEIVFGVYGGKSESERADMIRQNRQEKAS
jgi:WhiB family redox-sensing transcriptional regulator